jgi:antitoxin VapB
MVKRTKRKGGRLREPAQRYIPYGIDQAGERMQTAKLFKNGRSQAVRLPKEFRFEGDEVYVKRDGDSVVLLPKKKPKGNAWKDFFAALDMYDPAFPIERHQQGEQQVRKSIEELFAPRRRRSARKK